MNCEHEHDPEFAHKCPICGECLYHTHLIHEENSLWWECPDGTQFQIGRANAIIYKRVAAKAKTAE